AGELEEPANSRLGAGCAPALSVAQPCERCNHRPDRHTWVHERVELPRQLELAYARGSDLADPRHARTQPGRLEIHHHIGRALERELGARWRRQANGVPTPRHPCVLAY